MKKEYLLTDNIIFDSKPDAVPFNYRLSYKVGQICLILSMGNGGMSLLKIHLLSMALYTKEGMTLLKDYVDNNINYTIIRFDPVINRALNFTIGDGLVSQQKNGLLRLTKKGKQFVDLINKEINIMLKEKHFLSEYANRLTEDKIKKLETIWGYSNVANK
jgi:hypothetical protein